MSDNHEKVIAKIRALMAKTVENGCTEEEAMAAAMKASALIDKYDIEYKDVHGEKSDITETKITAVTFSDVRYFCNAVITFCDCDYLIRTIRSENKKYVVVIGRELDRILAENMLVSIYNSIETEWKKYWSAHIKTGARSEYYHARKSFMLGISKRIKERIKVMKEERSKTSNSHALVVSRIRDAEEYTEANYPNLKEARSKKSVFNPKHLKSGYAVGDNIHIGTVIKE